MKAWIEALRLRTLPLSVAGVLIAAGIAAFFESFSWAVFIPMLIMVLLLQIIANFADEYGDLAHGVDNEMRIGPIRGMQRGDITREQMKRALIIACVAVSLVIIWLLVISFKDTGDVAGFVVFLVLGALCIVASIKYTVGRGAYGYYGLGDLATFLTFGLLAVAGGFYLYAHTMLPVVFLPAVGIGCLVVGVLNLNNLRDHDNDKAGGKHTVVVALGPVGGKVYHALLICVGVACFVAFPIVCGITAPARYIYLAFCALLLVQLISVLKVEDPADYDRFMKPLSMTNAFLALAFCLCLGL